jgi:PAS domain S-box-containing protein
MPSVGAAYGGTSTVVIVADTTSRPWPATMPPPVGARLFDREQVARLDQSRASMPRLNVLAKPPMTEAWFPDAARNKQGVIAVAPARSCDELPDLATNLVRRRRSDQDAWSVNPAPHGTEPPCHACILLETGENNFGMTELTAVSQTGVATDPGLDPAVAREVAAAHLAAIVASSDDAILSKNLDSIIISWNAGAERMFGYSAGEIVGRPITKLIPPEIIEEEERILAQLRAGQRIEHYETVRVTKDGRRLNVSLTISPVHDSTGRIVAASKIIHDITERKQAEDKIRLLMREVNHRAGNLLSIVQAIVRQTAKGADPATFAARLSDRIAGLAACQALLVHNEWRGVDVAGLVRSQIAVFADPGGGRVTISGPPLLLRPPAAQAIGMALHELAANARRHGALSGAAGRVDVAWELDTAAEPEFVLRWREHGGPAVTRPVLTGFGQKVIVTMTEAAVHGRVEIDYGEAGLTWRLRAPMRGNVEPA